MWLYPSNISKILVYLLLVVTVTPAVFFLEQVHSEGKVFMSDSSFFSSAGGLNGNSCACVSPYCGWVLSFVLFNRVVPLTHVVIRTSHLVFSTTTFQTTPTNQTSRKYALF